MKYNIGKKSVIFFAALSFFLLSAGKIYCQADGVAIMQPANETGMEELNSLASYIGDNLKTSFMQNSRISIKNENETAVLISGRIFMLQGIIKIRMEMINRANKALLNYEEVEGNKGRTILRELDRLFPVMVKKTELMLQNISAQQAQQPVAEEKPKEPQPEPEYIGFSGWNVDFCFEGLQMKSYYPVYNYDFSQGPVASVSQGENLVDLRWLSIRIFKLRETQIRNLFAGIELGAGLPIKNGIYKEELPADAALLIYSSKFTNNIPSNSFVQRYTEEIAFAEFPILGRLLLKIHFGETASMDFGLAGGGYISSIKIKEKKEKEYVIDSGLYKAGQREVLFDYTTTMTSINYGGEISLFFNFGLGRPFSLGLGGRIMYMKPEVPDETTGYFSDDYSGTQKLMTIKNMYGFNGVAYGVSINLNFNF